MSRPRIDRVFEKMYLAGQLDTPAMGIIYTTPLEKLATHIPDEILEKLSVENTWLRVAFYDRNDTLVV
jgi:hypothetical protein